MWLSSSHNSGKAKQSYHLVESRCQVQTKVKLEDFIKITTFNNQLISLLSDILQKEWSRVSSVRKTPIAIMSGFFNSTTQIGRRNSAVATIGVVAGFFAYKKMTSGGSSKVFAL